MWSLFVVCYTAKSCKFLSRTILFPQYWLAFQVKMRRALSRQRLRHGENLQGGRADGAPPDWWRKSIGYAEGQGLPRLAAGHFTLGLAMDKE